MTAKDAADTVRQLSKSVPTRSVESGQLSILLLVGTTVGIVYVARIRQSPTDVLRRPGQMLRIGFGGALLALLLLMLARADVTLAKGLAWLVLVGTLLTYGPAALPGFTSQLSAPVSAPGARPGSGTSKLGASSRVGSGGGGGGGGSW